MSGYHDEEYFDYYWQTAQLAKCMSRAIKRQVGAVVVTESGYMFTGYNQMPNGWDTDVCEERKPTRTCTPTSHLLTTKPEVIHAERVCMTKMARAGISTENCLLFISYGPCLDCAKAIYDLGFKAIYYDEPNTKSAGVDFLQKLNIPIYNR